MNEKWDELSLERSGPSVRGALAVFVCASAGIPTAIAIDRATSADLSWLVALPVAALTWSVYALTWREQRWQLIGVSRAVREVLAVGEHGELVTARERLLLGATLPVVPAQAPFHRLVFLDLVRTLAVLLMIFAHFTDQLLAPEHRASTFGSLYGLTRGFAAPLFFVISGWSYAVAILPRWRAEGLVGLNVGRRLKRAAILLCWGYAITLPWWAPGFPFDAPAEVWRPFWTAGVLECLGATLLITVGLALLGRRPWPFLGLCLLVALAAVLLTPEVTARVAGWPEPLRGFFDKQGVPGGFPLTPWAGYFLAGVVLGGGLVLTGAQATTRILLLLLASAALGWGYLHVEPLHQLVLLRLGVTCATLGFAALLTARAAREPPLLKHISRHALSFYVAHMLMLWGLPFVFGLASRFAGQLTWAQCGALTLLSIALTSLGLEGFSRSRHWWSKGRALARQQSSAGQAG